MNLRTSFLSRSLFISAMRKNILLKTQRTYSVTKQLCDKVSSTGPSQMMRQLSSKIKLSGPLTVADYMKEVLTNPVCGYYITKDILGKEGDFTTSPEISQMFGEIVGVWMVHEWMKLGSPLPLQIAELGPGRGTLANHVQKAFLRFVPQHQDRISMSLVEISPVLSSVQEALLCGQFHDTVVEGRSGESYKGAVTKYGLPVKWYAHLDDVPKLFTLFLAHEFFDCLPVHKFERSEVGYRELLVDLDPAADFESLRFVIARERTPACVYLDGRESRQHVEVSPASAVVAEKMARRVDEFGGISLIVDYGHDGEGGDTFRSFRDHRQQQPLLDPGTADLTADVDFSYINRVTEKNTLNFGPVEQGRFLKEMGIEVRMEMLKNNAPEEAKSNLVKQYSFLVDDDKMGKCFKFFAMYPKTVQIILDKFPPAGFS